MQKSKVCISYCDVAFRLTVCPLSPYLYPCFLCFCLGVIFNPSKCHGMTSTNWHSKDEVPYLFCHWHPFWRGTFERYQQDLLRFHTLWYHSGECSLLQWFLRGIVSVAATWYVRALIATTPTCKVGPTVFTQSWINANWESFLVLLLPVFHCISTNELSVFLASLVVEYSSPARVHLIFFLFGECVVLREGFFFLGDFASLESRYLFVLWSHCFVFDDAKRSLWFTESSFGELWSVLIFLAGETHGDSNVWLSSRGESGASRFCGGRIFASIDHSNAYIGWQRGWWYLKKNETVGEKVLVFIWIFWREIFPLQRLSTCGLEIDIHISWVEILNGGRFYEDVKVRVMTETHPTHLVHEITHFDSAPIRNSFLSILPPLLHLRERISTATKDSEVAVLHECCHVWKSYISYSTRKVHVGIPAVTFYVCLLIFAGGNLPKGFFWHAYRAIASVNSSATNTIPNCSAALPILWLSPSPSLRVSLSTWNLQTSLKYM